MIYPALGFWLLFKEPLFDSDRVARVASLLTDERWPWQPQLVRPMSMPGEPLYPWPAGKISAHALRATIEDVLRSPSTTAIHLAMSRKDAGNQVDVIVDNGRPQAFQARLAYPFRAIGSSRYPVPAGKNIDDWLALIRELVTVLDAVHGVIWVETDERYVIARQFVSGWAAPSQPADYPGNESHRINRARDLLGEKYVRFPGWATFLRSAHVEAIGGREKLMSVVKPAVVHDVGDLLYVQLSESVDDALAPETEARRQAFIALVEPILVPWPAK